MNNAEYIKAINEILTSKAAEEEPNTIIKIIYEIALRM